MLDNLSVASVTTAFKTVASKELSKAETIKALVPFICGGIIIGVEIVMIYDLVKTIREIFNLYKERE